MRITTQNFLLAHQKLWRMFHVVATSEMQRANLQ